MELDEQVALYKPYQNEDGWVVEETAHYLARMQATVLPNWPAEVLNEWLYRHHNQIGDYAFLEFASFTFTREVWPLARIPGREAYADEGTFECFYNIEYRLQNPHDWLAHFMFHQGTWNTPVILLDNGAGLYAYPDGDALKQPNQLLEGHRRLAFLNDLCRLGKALPEHPCWVVRKRPGVTLETAAAQRVIATIQTDANNGDRGAAVWLRKHGDLVRALTQQA